MLLVAYLAYTKMMQKPLKIVETLANGYSSDSTQRELSYEYPDDLVRMISNFFLHSCALGESNLSIRRVKGT